MSQKCFLSLLGHTVYSQLAFNGSKSTIETLEKGVKYVFIVNFEHISHLFLVILLLTLSK